MKHTNTFPDLGQSFQLMKLQDAIADNGIDHPISKIWALNAYNNFGEVLKEIHEQMADQMGAVENLLGYEAAGLYHQIFPVVRLRNRAKNLMRQIDLC